MSASNKVCHSSPCFQRAVGGIPERFQVRTLFIFLLGLVLVGALEIPEWLVLIFDLPVPWMGRTMTYFAPLLPLVIAFNLLAAKRLGHLTSMPLAAVALCVVFLSVAGIECGHWLAASGSGDLNAWLILDLTWLLAYYMALVSFGPHLPDCREYVVRITIILAGTVALLDLVFVLAIAPTWGGSHPWLKASQLFDSAYVAYLSVLASALLLFEVHPGGANNVLRKVILLLMLAGAAAIQRLTGPLLLLVGILLLAILARLPMTGRQWWRVAAGTILAAVGISLYLWLQPDDPTVQGLRGGAYFFDEIGVLHGDVISGYIRRETILEELRLLQGSPIFGVGMSIAGQVKVMMNGPHASAILMLAAWGLLGMTLMLSWMLWYVAHWMRWRGVSALAIPMIVAGHSMLSPNPAWWWAVALYLISTPEYYAVRKITFTRQVEGGGNHG